MNLTKDTSGSLDVSREDRPRRSLKRRLLFWAAVLVLAPTFVCALWLNDIARGTLSRNNVRTVELLAQTVSASLSGRLVPKPAGDEGTGSKSGSGRWTAEAQAVIDGLILDPRVGFVIVVDAKNQPLYQGPIDPQAWVGFMQRAEDFSGSSIEPVAPIRLADGDELVVRKVPIWNLPVRKSGPHRWAGGGRQLEGFVLLGM